MPYSNDEASQQERREYILGTEPITDADALSISEVGDRLADMLDTSMNFCNPEQAGLREQASAVLRAFVALKMKGMGL